MGKAEKYAAGKANEAIDKAIAQAYADGYRDGYKDKEDVIPTAFLNNETKYVDLGLPSGTLWSTDYEKDGEETKYMPYCNAESLSIPTQEQWDELRNTCKWEHVARNGRLETAVCIGPNGGEPLKFRITAMKKYEESEGYFYEALFWIKDESDEKEKQCGRISGIGSNSARSFFSFYSGYKLPVRLVKTKKCNLRI